MLGNILRLIRIANENMSGKDVATKMGVSSTYISEVEHGNKIPSLEMLRKFAEVYKLPVSKILLFDELQTQHSLTNQQVLIHILEHYINENEKNVEIKGKQF